MSAEQPERVRAAARLARVGVAAALVSRVFGRLVGLVLVVVLARTSDPSVVALYGFLLGTVTLMVSVTDLGVASLAGRDVAVQQFRAPEALRMALVPQLLSAAVAVLLTCILCLAAGPQGVGTAVLLPCSAFVIFNALFNLWSEVLRGAGLVVVEGLLQGLSALVLVVAGTAAVLAGAGITELMWIVAGKEILVLGLAVLRLPPQLRVEGGLSLATVVRRSVWLAVAGTALVTLWRQGTLLVSASASTRALADYVVATRFLDASVTLSQTVGIGLFPAMAALAEREPEPGRRQERMYLLVAAGVGLPAAALGTIFAGRVTTALFGDEWTSAVAAVRVLAIALPAVAVSYLLFFALLARGQERWLCVAAVSGSAVALVATLLLLRGSPTATSGATGTALGVTTMAALLLHRWLTFRPRNGCTATDVEPSACG